MNLRQTYAFAIASATLIIASGCAVTRGQESVGAYVDDTAITTAVKARFIDNTNVDAASIKVETLNGTVMLSGFAKNGIEAGHQRRRRADDRHHERRELGVVVKP